MDQDKVLLATNNSREIGAAEATQALARAVQEAGALARRMRKAGVRVWNKQRNSPVTEADIAVDVLLRERLLQVAPDYGWQSEESELVAGGPQVRRRWVVDPIDGTRAFIGQQSDWSIAAALVDGGLPIAAVIYAPTTDELFLASHGGGATRNGVAIHASFPESLRGARIAGPKSTLERLAQSGVPFEAVPRIHSLALRFARVAAGDIDVALASERSRDWDLAAAHLLVHEAGGLLTTSDGRPLNYDRPEAEHPPLAAAGKGLYPALIAALDKVEQ